MQYVELGKNEGRKLRGLWLDGVGTGRVLS